MYPTIPLFVDSAEKTGMVPPFSKQDFKSLLLTGSRIKKSSNLYSPHLTVFSFSLSEAFIFPGVRSPHFHFSVYWKLPKPNNH